MGSSHKRRNRFKSVSNGVETLGSRIEEYILSYDLFP
jgi:hypothetical protein